MFRMLRIGRIATIITTGLLITGAESADANSPDVSATTIPAAACQPVTPAQDAMVSMVFGAWVFNGANTGTVTFLCPLPINGNTTASDPFNNETSHFRVYYRDTDGSNPTNAAEVTARLAFRTNAFFAVGAAWTSNTINVSTDTTATHPVIHNMSSSALYSFLVTLRRNNAGENPAFAGIDFPRIIPQ